MNGSFFGDCVGCFSSDLGTGFVEDTVDCLETDDIKLFAPVAIDTASFSGCWYDNTGFFSLLLTILE
jgi:hypothetical protein